MMLILFALFSSVDLHQNAKHPAHRMETNVIVAHYIGAGNLFGNLTDGEFFC